jgi:hypothetical protein
MKAEHRKELQTNTLADMLGRTVRKVRSTSQVPWVKVAVVVAVAGGIGLFVWLRANKARTNSELWTEVDAGTITVLAKLSEKDYQDTNQGKAARFQLAFELLWNQGIKMMGYNPKYAQSGIIKGLTEYEKMIEEKEVKGDPVLEPEAMYNVAVGYETLTAFDAPIGGPNRLDEALKKYQELAKHSDYGKTAYGLQAQKRAAQLSDPAQRDEILRFYQELGTRTKIGREDLLPHGK